MVNTDDFIKRLEILLEFYSLSASVFADKMGVQRSGLSHLMSGRNKPSLDFVMKIVENFPEVDLYWLLNGTGSFPKKDDYEDDISEKTQSPSTPLNDGNSFDLFSTEEIIPEKKVHYNNAPSPDLFSINKQKQPNDVMIGKKEIEKIVIFYSDGTFKNYNPEH